jgi:malonyl-CoA O-methyltransferase
MLERLAYLKIAPRRILDAGSGPGRDAAKLRSRYPAGEVFAVDFSRAMLEGGKKRFFDQRRFIAADLLRLPFASGALDFVWSNLALHWTEPEAAIGEFARVLAPEGLLMFSTLGPDTLQELRAAAGAARVHEFFDMHDLGDMLVAAGFAAPVMDVETLTFTYQRAGAARGSARERQTNARRDRARGLMGKGLFEKSSIPRQAVDLRGRLRPRVERRAAQARRRTRHRAVSRAARTLRVGFC